MRLKDATVFTGTQCSALAVWSVHMNLVAIVAQRSAVGSTFGRIYTLVKRQVRVCKVKLD